MDKFSDRFSYDKTSNRDSSEDVSPFRVVFEKRAILQTLVITAFTLLLLTAVALVWPWDDLPHRRSFDIVLKLMISGFAAAVAEEIFFRGWMQPALRRRYSAAVSIVAVNLVFAPLHLIAAPYLISLLTFFPGLIMGWLRERYGNILPSIIFHFLGNVWAIWFFPSPF
ncbi:MAG: Synerg-CTERM system glutamic-type intramembrane protease MrtS [Synergistaceae bacterium]|nr:Synerg-CTERM system glutamic-type intramembrane protease MrtS [Synergistaceae bacterium]